MSYTRSNRGKKRGKTSKKTKSNTKPTANFSKKVMSVVSRAAETKCAAPLIYRKNPIMALLDNNLTQCIPLMPNIAQGEAQGDRIGNSVSTKTVMLYLQSHMYQISTPANSDPPKFVDYYIYKYKPTNSQSSIDLRQFLQYGSTSTSYDGTNLPESGGLNVNNDKFTLKKHIRRQLWCPDANNTYALATRNVQNANALKLNITKMFKKDLLYNDNVSNIVSNDNLFISVVYTNNDGQQYSTDQVVGEFDITVLFKYDDF